MGYGTPAPIGLDSRTNEQATTTTTTTMNKAKQVVQSAKQVVQSANEKTLNRTKQIVTSANGRTRRYSRKIPLSNCAPDPRRRGITEVCRLCFTSFTLPNKKLISSAFTEYRYALAVDTYTKLQAHLW